jgi:hypothetical protein
MQRGNTQSREQVKQQVHRLTTGELVLLRSEKQPMTHLARPINRVRGNGLPVGSFQVVVGLFQLPDPERRFVALRPKSLDLNLQLRDAAVVLPVQALEFVLQQQSSPLFTRWTCSAHFQLHFWPPFQNLLTRQLRRLRRFLKSKYPARAVKDFDIASSFEGTSIIVNGQPWRYLEIRVFHVQPVVGGP